MAAALLKFDPSRRRAPGRDRSGGDEHPIQDGGAKVLMFTGVRIERASEDMDTASRPDTEH